MKKRPPIPYAPEVDEVQDAVNKKGKEGTCMIKLPDKTQFTVNIWDTCTPEAFLIHVQTVVNACKRKGLLSAFDDATNDVDALSEKLTTYREVIGRKGQEGYS